MNAKQAKFVAWGLFLALIAVPASRLLDCRQANAPVEVLRQPVPSKSRVGFDAGFKNPSTSDYRCEYAWFIVDPNMEPLRGAIEAEPIVFSAESARYGESERVYYTANIADKGMKAGQHGSFHVVIVDREHPGMIVRGQLVVRYSLNGKSVDMKFDPVDVEIQSRP